jgi:signal transduction histidine kinase/ligand-binding sensor domain-containing protein
MPSLTIPFMSTLRPALAGLLVALSATLLPLAGQQPAFRKFGLRDGLPQSQVTTLLADRHGFLWVGTNTGGVARLGASGFHTFAGPQGLKALTIHALLEDPSGGIWVASQEGLSVIRGEAIRNFGASEGLDTSETLTVGLDQQDRLLVGKRSGLFRMEEGRFTRVDLPAPWKGGLIRRLARDPAGGIWLQGKDDQVARWDAQGLRLHVPQLPSGMKVRDLQIDPTGKAWLLLDGQLLRMVQGSWVPEPLADLPPAPKMTSLRFDPQGGGFHIALGGDGVLIKEASGRFHRYTSAMGLPRDRLSATLRDHRGVLWVGSDGDGLAAQALPNLLTVEGSVATGGKDLGAVMGFLELAPGHFLMSTSTGLYQVEQGRGITGHWTTANGLPSNELWDMASAGPLGVWVGSDRGLAIWKAGRVQPAGPREMAKLAIISLTRLGEDLYAGTDQGLFILDAKGRLKAHHRLPSELGRESITNILSYQGRLLAATEIGLWEWAGNHFVPAFPTAPFATAAVSAITIDSRGRLWIGTMKGLHLWTGSTWATYGVGDGLPDETINFITDVGQGRMVFGHNQGVTILEGRTLHHLSRSQGLLSDETNHDGFLLDSRGRLWIGMIGGACILQDVHSFRNAPLPAPTLLDLRWPEGSQSLPHEAVVPPRPDFLDFTFDTGAPLAPSRILYQAYVQGVDEGWRPVNQGLTLQYRNLGAGRYQFRQRTSTDGVSWTEAAPVSIHVLPAWHERWLVRGVLALGFILLLAWLLWLRVHTLALRSRDLEDTIEERTLLLARQNRALERAHAQIKRSLEGRLKLLDMVTHDLRSPLTSILLTMDRLRELAPEQLSLLDVMEREAHRIEALVRNLLDQSRSETLLQTLKLTSVVPSEVTEGFEEVLRLKAQAKGLSFHLEISPDTKRVRIEADTATLHQVLLNLYENALKFTPSGGSIGVRSLVDFAEDTWCLEVWDTGRGLDAAKIEEILQPFRQVQAGDAAQGWGLGLSICQSILEAHRGELRIDSEPGQGARFRMVLPLAPMGR